MLREWPMALVAELRGARWHVALNQEHHGEVRARAADDPDDIVTAAITGIPYTAAWASDDCVLVTTSTGLWEWTPRRAARLVAAVPAAAIIDVSAESVRLDPIPVIDGHYQPRVLSEGWHVSRAHGTITRHVLDAAGQAWSRTTRGAVVATAHPEAHVIRFDSSDTTCWLAWHRPRGVAWIDDQLLVWGADGRVALVPDAWSHVTGALAGTSPGRVSVPTE
jgi:hypothetical protein